MPQFAMQLLPNPLPPRYTLTQYLIDQRKRYPEASGDFNSLMLDVGLACKAISRSVAFGKLNAMPGQPIVDAGCGACMLKPAAGEPHASAEKQVLDWVSNECFASMNN